MSRIRFPGAVNAVVVVSPSVVVTSVDGTDSARVETLAARVIWGSGSTPTPPTVVDRLASVASPGLAEAAAQPGLRAEFLSAVKEIKEQGDDPLPHARAHFDEGSRGRRLFEAFERYTNLLREEQAFDHEDLLVACRDRLRAEPRRLASRANGMVGSRT